MSSGVPCMWMRGGTSKGGYFLAEDLPSDRDGFLLRIMGSPDKRQIDGMGGADPLTSKIAVVKKSAREGIDLDYLFLQVFVDEPLVSDGQNCGNILAGVAPFAIERGLIEATGDLTKVSIYLENTKQIAVASIVTKDGKPVYDGDASIHGVPGSSAPIPLEFKDTAGSTCGALLPTGNIVDEINGIEITMIDNGMPVIVLDALSVGKSGKETREELDNDAELKEKLEAIRLVCGPLMNLGDVREKTVPKFALVSTSNEGGVISTRSFTPHRCHASIGVFAAVSVATACLLPGSPAAKLANVPAGKSKVLSIEHPIGEITVLAEMSEDGTLKSTSLQRTARKLFDGVVFD